MLPTLLTKLLFFKHSFSWKPFFLHSTSFPTELCHRIEFHFPLSPYFVIDFKDFLLSFDPRSSTTKFGNNNTTHGFSWTVFPEVALQKGREDTQRVWTHNKGWKQDEYLSVGRHRREEIWQKMPFVTMRRGKFCSRTEWEANSCLSFTRREKSRWQEE